MASGPEGESPPTQPPAPPVLVGVPVCDPPEVTAEDVCDESVEVAFAEETVEEGGNIAVIRTWTATDACGETVH